jgi:hypothetical protein
MISKLKSDLEIKYRTTQVLLLPAVGVVRLAIDW